MKAEFAAVLVMGALIAGCTAGGDISGPGLEPIPGSITYSGQPRTKLTKSPIGSSFPHTFYDNRGREVEETYIIRPDRSLMIANRVYRPFFDFDDDR
ncbi:hypothetical protein [Rhizobium sullae]|uniref:Uncharacterized protein n=1 Tax=Rhizobium sullae TaxID=50338 RepID=A0A2N0D0V7_RHISU|nr:hypothetical protein [Rhizobium sullae]PKA39729.1 hypothetical protein CWR43_31210 [Rhizobium sullae]UWU16157.1 hypothetical protein N2599_09290 [Rhizobium sullae]